jgi:PIN like domain
VKVFVDHNISPRVARALAALFAGEHECVALRDKFRNNITDIDWIASLSNEDRWVVISGDRRIRRNKAEYRAFRKSRLIGFFLSKGLQKASVVKQTERILAQWNAIENQFASVQGGAIFELQMKGTYLAQIKG